MMASVRRTKSPPAQRCAAQAGTARASLHRPTERASVSRPVTCRRFGDWSRPVASWGHGLSEAHSRISQCRFRSGRPSRPHPQPTRVDLRLGIGAATRHRQQPTGPRLGAWARRASAPAAELRESTHPAAIPRHGQPRGAPAAAPGSARPASVVAARTADRRPGYRPGPVTPRGAPSTAAALPARGAAAQVDRAVLADPVDPVGLASRVATAMTLVAAARRRRTRASASGGAGSR